MRDNIILKEESYELIGICMEIHSILGGGLSETVYKDAMEVEFDLRDIPYAREKAFDVWYKGVLLPHKFIADFVVYDDIILEAKVASDITDKHVSQTINYVKLAQGQLGLILNFGNASFESRRIVV